MSTIESNEQIEYVIEEVFHRLNEILQTSLIIICVAFGVLIFSAMYLLKPFNQFRTTAPVTRVRSCPCLKGILPDMESNITEISNLKDYVLDIKSRNMKGNDGIKLNSNPNVEKPSEKVGTKDSGQGPSEYEIDEDFLREVGFEECCKLPHTKDTGEQINN